MMPPCSCVATVPSAYSRLGDASLCWQKPSDRGLFFSYISRLPKDCPRLRSEEKQGHRGNWQGPIFLHQLLLRDHLFFFFSLLAREALQQAQTLLRSIHRVAPLS